MMNSWDSKGGTIERMAFIKGKLKDLRQIGSTPEVKGAAFRVEAMLKLAEISDDNEADLILGAIAAGWMAGTIDGAHGFMQAVLAGKQ